MANNIKEINKKLKSSISTKINLLEDYPEKFINPSRNALNTNVLDLSSYKLMDSELISFVIPFLDTHVNIKHLNISDNQVSAEGVKALARNHTLTTLNVSYNQIGDEGVKALAQNHTLTTLDVGYNQLGVEGAKALVQNHALTTLDVNYNLIGKRGKETLQTALERRQKAYVQQKVAFAMGTHPRLGEASPILIFSKYGDKNLMREIFSYVKPRPFIFNI